MNLAHVVKKAILSEKAYKQMEKGSYSFLVDSRATKKEIAKAVAKQFSVKVKKVRTIPVAAKKKRILKTRKQVKVGGGKKAIVQLISGQSISMLLPKTDGTKKKTKETKPKETKPKE